MVRDTSIEAYVAMLESGDLGRRQVEALDLLLRHPGSTGAELLDFLKQERPNLTLTEANVTHSNIRTRLCELRTMGLAMENGTRICAKSGKRCIEWLPMPVGTLPLPEEQRPLTGKAAVQAAVLEKAAIWFEKYGTDDVVARLRLMARGDWAPTLNEVMESL